jgi:ketosteroid isomerase-like protein
MAPGADALKGREAIRAGLQAAIDEAGGNQMAIKPGEVMSSGDVATEIGTLVETAANGSRKDHGNYIAVWKKLDGSWKIVRDIWNSSM